jgi:threonine dehydratase
LVGLQASAKDRREVKKFLDDLGYRYTDETENEAYQFFLASE